MNNKNRATTMLLVIILLFFFVLLPSKSAKAFWPFKDEPKSVPSDELTLILEAGRKGLADELEEGTGEGGFCEAAIMDLALGKLIELTQKNLLDKAWQTFIKAEKIILSGGKEIGKSASEIIIAMGKEAAKQLFEEEKERRLDKAKNEKVVISGRTGTGCDYKMTVDWINKEKRAHVLLEGDCHCRRQSTSMSKSNSIPVPIAKFKTEFDIEYYYDEVEYETSDGQKQKVLGVAGGIKKREQPYNFPLENICQSWYEGRGEGESGCGCQDGRPVKKISAGPGMIKPDSALSFADAAAEKAGMFFAFSPAKKATRALGYADEKLAEAIWLTDNDNLTIIETTNKRYEYFMSAAWREIEKIKDEAQKGKMAALFSEELIVDEKTMEELISRSVISKDEEQKERLRRAWKAFGEFVNILNEKYKKAEEARREQVLGKSAGKDKNTQKGKKADEAKEIKTENKKPDNGEKKQKSEKAVQPKPADESAVRPVDVCGDGKITGSEICDGNLFSQQCQDSLLEYQVAFENPNFVLRCFNSCRGCEASMPGR